MLTTFFGKSMGTTGGGISISESSDGPRKFPQGKSGVGVVVGTDVCVDPGMKVPVDVGLGTRIIVGAGVSETNGSEISELSAIPPGGSALHEARRMHRMLININADLGFTCVVNVFCTRSTDSYPSNPKLLKPLTGTVAVYPRPTLAVGFYVRITDRLQSRHKPQDPVIWIALEFEEPRIKVPDIVFSEHRYSRLRDMGIAMGAAGSDVAIEAAHIALMLEDWTLVPEVFRIAQRTLKVVKVNLPGASKRKLFIIFRELVRSICPGEIPRKKP